MIDVKGEWNISLAGCGFLGVYYVGLASCFLERAPFIIKEANKICGASSGALTAAVLAIGMPLAKCCEDLMGMAKAARKRRLGPLHPSFNLVKTVRDSLNRDLPADAHLRASGRLCVSLTRVRDGENVLVTEFASREELIQALVCSCFIPVYSGVIPPSFRGVRYVDGALSNNLPLHELRNSITVSPFSGESDICPRDNPANFHTVRVGNVSFQVTLSNVQRVTRVFFPPDPEVLAEMCQNGYKDGLQFLKENNLLSFGCPSVGLDVSEFKVPAPTCCSEEEYVQSPPAITTETESTKEKLLRKLCPQLKQHWWLDLEIVNCLPHPIKKVFCKACREKHGLYNQVTDLLPVRMASYMLLPYTLPVESAYSVAQRLAQRIPKLSEDVQWLFGVAGVMYVQVWKVLGPVPLSEAPVYVSMASALAPRESHKDVGHLQLSAIEFHSCDQDCPTTLPLPPTPPPTPPCVSTQEATPPHLSGSLATLTGKTDAPPTPKEIWMLCLTWAVGWLSPLTFDPTL
ncbi:patatin-like phospholipase domain-containing protein 2 [Megalops cyprinoides]|uniref:patatin-like phospholipase domain-containing protein 2 n=1 Tax=Megalops cyprinoides TaxID=118141 RepID=UPI001863DD0D|nr:patatin-like phospholipase domain-containing protein 2 [Megalops cyprinoides]